VGVILRQGPANEAVVHTDDNILPLIDTRVENGVLRISPRPGRSFRTKHAIVVNVEVPDVSGIDVEGSGDIQCARWDGDVLQLTVRGSGDVRFDALRVPAVAVLIAGSGDVQLAGKVPRQGFVIEGSGDIKAGELAGEEVAVRIHGSGDAHVWATRALTAEVAGSGDVRYRGTATVVRNIMGSGEVVHVDQ